MGHRALVAYQDSSGKYDVHYSHWGAADLALHKPLENGLEPGEKAGELENVPVGHNQLSVESDPYGSNVTLQELGHEVVQYWDHEAVYVVPSIGEVKSYVTLNFRFPSDESESYHDGALVSPRWIDRTPLVGNVTTRFGGWKDVATDMVENGEWSVETAKSDLEERVYGNWGAPSNTHEIPEWSPRGHTPRQGVVSLSDYMAKAEREITNPDR